MHVQLRLHVSTYVYSSSREINAPFISKTQFGEVNGSRFVKLCLSTYPNAATIHQNQLTEADEIQIVCTATEPRLQSAANGHASCKERLPDRNPGKRAVQSVFSPKSDTLNF